MAARKPARRPPAFDLITVVAQRRDERKVLEAAEKAGARGATYFYGRGTGVRQRFGFRGSLIEAEKVVVLIATPPRSTRTIVKAVSKAAELDKPARGFLYVQKIRGVVGYVGGLGG